MKQAEDFLNVLFDDTDIINFRLIPTNGKILNKWWSLVKTEICDEVDFDFLKQKNKEGYNIYFGGNPRKEAGVDFIPNNISEEEKAKLKAKGKGDDSVEICRSVFVDFDHKDFPNVLWENLLPHIKTLIKDFPNPLFIILSGHGYHCWWRLKESLLPDKWKNIQERLIATLGSDGTIKNTERIIRLPGFLNVKEQPFVECIIKEIGTCTTKLEDIEKHLVDIDAKEKSVNDTPKSNRPTWIEDELKHWNLINKDSKINSKGEVMVISCDPELESARTQINIFTGKWYNFSHDSHPELRNNGFREGWAPKYFAAMYMKRRKKDGLKEIPFKKAEKKTDEDLLLRYGTRFSEWIKNLLNRFKEVFEKQAKDKAAYNPTEEELELLRNQINNGEITDLVLSLRNPTKTAYYLHRIFYPNKLIYRDDFEIYGQKDAVGIEYKFYKIAYMKDLTENTYKLLSHSTHKVVIGSGIKSVAVFPPIVNIEPKHVTAVLKRLESMEGICFDPKKYIIPHYKNGKPYNQVTTIPFKDYDWNWVTDKEENKATSDVVLHGRLAYNRTPGAELSEAAWQYLRSTFSDDTIALIRNVMKYLLTMSHTEQKMFYITGRKGRGKGVLFHIIIELIGRHNFALVSPHTLSTANGLLEAEGKMLGGCGDARWGAFKHLSEFIAQQLLAIINREPVEMKKLWKDIYKTILDIRLLMCGENLPSELADDGVHLDDKIIVMPVKKDALNWRKTDNETKELKYILSTPEELAGWCEWALGGDLSDIRNRKEGEKKIDEMTITQSPVHNYLECLEYDTNYKIGMRIKDVQFYEYKEKLFTLFKSFLYFIDEKKLVYKGGETKFRADLESALENKGEYRRLYFAKEGKKHWYFAGIRIIKRWLSDNSGVPPI